MRGQLLYGKLLPMSVKSKMHEIIFEADTPAGKFFDVLLLWCILLSVTAVVLESVQSISSNYALLLKSLEWTFTILFTLEYLLRIYCVKKPSQYIFSFFGAIDFLAIIPTYISLIVAGSHYLAVIRAVRLLRVFRILKLARYLGSAHELSSALKASRAKIVVFLGVVGVIVLCIGSFLYLIEGPENGYTSIPKGMYWAIVTLTTVGYGDITPQTPFGQAISALVMVLGYGIIAVPTGIVSAEISKARKIPHLNSQVCENCHCSAHEDDAIFCKKCGKKLHIGNVN